MIASKPKKMDVHEPIYRWLTEIKIQLTQARLRDESLPDRFRSQEVTWPEVWEHVKAEYERQAASQ